MRMFLASVDGSSCHAHAQGKRPACTGVACYNGAPALVARPGTHLIAGLLGQEKKCAPTGRTPRRSQNIHCHRLRLRPAKPASFLPATHAAPALPASHSRCINHSLFPPRELRPCLHWHFVHVAPTLSGAGEPWAKHAHRTCRRLETRGPRWLVTRRR
jgi:hypothetical protein